ARPGRQCRTGLPRRAAATAHGRRRWRAGRGAHPPERARVRAACRAAGARPRRGSRPGRRRARRGRPAADRRQRRHALFAAPGGPPAPAGRGRRHPARAAGHGGLRAGGRAPAAAGAGRAGRCLRASGAGGTRTPRNRRDPRRRAAGQSARMRRLKRRRQLRISAAVALLLASTAFAQARDEVLLLDLCLNARCSGIAAVVVRGERVLVDREALLAAGLDPTALPAERIQGRDFVEAAALGRGIEVLVDRDNLRLDLRQRPADMPAQSIDLRTRGRAAPSSPSWTAFANYAATLGDGGAEGPGAGLETLFVDAAVRPGPAALRSPAIRDRSFGWRRGLSRIEIDQPSSLRRWTIGDQVAVARDPLGGGALLGGVGVARAFDQDPYLVTFPQPFYQGVIETPGVVEVYANGALIGRRPVEAGPINLDNLGVPPGRSDVRVVIRDPFGNRQDLASASYYGGTGLLAPGL